MKYQTRVMVVEARRITEKNLDQIRKWCGGDWRMVHNHVQAVVGNWIVKLEGGQSIAMSNTTFKEKYGPVRKPDRYDFPPLRLDEV